MSDDKLTFDDASEHNEKPEVAIDGRGYKVDKKLEAERNRKKYLRRKRKKALAEKAKERIEAISEKNEYFDEESEEWDDINGVPPPVELADEDDDTYVPPTLKDTVKQYTRPKQKEETDNKAEELKQLPQVGTSISNPLDLSGGNYNVFSIVEQLYGNIGYFILSEQTLPIKDQTIKLIQLKIDDGRYVNLFIKI